MTDSGGAAAVAEPVNHYEEVGESKASNAYQVTQPGAEEVEIKRQKSRMNFVVAALVVVIVALILLVVMLIYVMARTDSVDRVSFMRVR